MGGVSQDGTDGIRVFDDSDQTHPALATRTDEGIVDMTQQPVRPRYPSRASVFLEEFIEKLLAPRRVGERIEALVQQRNDDAIDDDNSLRTNAG